MIVQDVLRIFCKGAIMPLPSRSQGVTGAFGIVIVSLAIVFGIVLGPIAICGVILWSVIISAVIKAKGT